MHFKLAPQFHEMHAKSLDSLLYPSLFLMWKKEIEDDFFEVLLINDPVISMMRPQTSWI